MINLLPPEEKKEFFSRRKKTIVLIIFVLLLFFLSNFALALFFVKYSLQSEIISQKDLLSGENGESFQDAMQSVSAKIDSVNKKLADLDIFYNKNIYLQDVLGKISSILPQGVYLFSFNADTKESSGKKSLDISISGFAPTREALFEFKKNLENENDFKNIYFPPANWVKPSDIDFIVTFEVVK